MGEPLFRKEETPDFKKPSVQLRFVEQTQGAEDLIQKQLSVNSSEQLLLKQRIEMMKEFLNDLPASDPQYSMILIQLEMDKVELDEIKSRDIILRSKIS